MSIELTNKTTVISHPSPDGAVLEKMAYCQITMKFKYPQEKVITEIIYLS